MRPLVEEEIQLKGDLTESELGKLDRAAKKAKRILQDAGRAVRTDTTFSSPDQQGIGATLRGGIGNIRGGFGALLDPVSFITSKIPIVAAALIAFGFASQIAKQVVSELTKRNRPLDPSFQDGIDNRVNAFRDKQVEADIAAGFTQIVTTTRVGATARESYNTFEEFNNRSREFEEDFAIRNTSGID